jgi:uncharacterized membrane protein
MDINKLREPKFMDMAIFDLVGTFVVAFIIHIIMWKNYKGVNAGARTITQYIISLLFIFVTFVGIGIIFHSIFGVSSALSFYLGFNDKPIRK